MTPDTLWLAVYNELAETLPTHAINTWFEPISPVALSEKELVLEVPNQFFYEWIESHYKRNLNNAKIFVDCCDMLILRFMRNKKRS